MSGDAAHKFTDYSQTNQTLSAPLDHAPDSKHNSPNPAHHQQPSSRPGSAMAGQQTHQGQYQDQNRPPQQPSNSSVVIKVGMVGDAQIGKTSLMVKYVEGSWDEDYIQTLGLYLAANMSTINLT
jgi:Gtp-binding protein of the ras superfamily involved in termination of M-phase